MRVNKYISETGFCSRREADKLIEAKRVKINDKIAELGSIVESSDHVFVAGKLLESKKKHVYIALNKPVGITSTTERHIKGNIVDFVNHPERIFPIGRLDKDSEGLILMTSDGDIVNKILRSENNHGKEYIVTVDKIVTPEFIEGMAGGVNILGQTTKHCKVKKLGKYTFSIILTQGLNRQIRRMCEVFGYEVVELKRIRILNIRLNGLKVGQWRDLTKKELSDLMDIIQ